MKIALLSCQRKPASECPFMLDPPPSWHSLPSVSMTPLSPGSPLPDLVGATSQSPLLNLLPLFDPSMIVIKKKKSLQL